MTVTGCLKSGLAEDTFVLMASQANGTSDTATYQLTGREDIDVRQYLGQKVEVAGTVRAQQEVASTGEATAQKPAKGTSGTPSIETKTEIDVKRLDVKTITPTGTGCDQ